VARKGGRAFITGNSFPERLPEIGILAASAEKSCAACGAPWERIIEREVKPHPDRYSSKPDASQFSVAEGNYAEGGSLGALVEKTTLGFRPTCACDSAETVGSIVLDPFTGSGTTGRVALRLGRRFIGCEINESYAEMSRRGIDKWHITRPRTKPAPPKLMVGGLFDAE
jgi:hypothetical protein